jgi:hypothetical protein
MDGDGAADWIVAGKTSRFGQREDEGLLQPARRILENAARKTSLGDLIGLVVLHALSSVARGRDE